MASEESVTSLLERCCTERGAKMSKESPDMTKYFENGMSEASSANGQQDLQVYDTTDVTPDPTKEPYGTENTEQESPPIDTNNSSNVSSLSLDNAGRTEDLHNRYCHPHQVIDLLDGQVSNVNMDNKESFSQNSTSQTGLNKEKCGAVTNKLQRLQKDCVQCHSHCSGTKTVLSSCNSNVLPGLNTSVSKSHHNMSVEATFITMSPSQPAKCQRTCLELIAPNRSRPLFCRPADGINDSDIRIHYVRNSTNCAVHNGVPLCSRPQLGPVNGLTGVSNTHRHDCHRIQESPPTCRPGNICSSKTSANTMEMLHTCKIGRKLCSKLCTARHDNHQIPSCKNRSMRLLRKWTTLKHRSSLHRFATRAMQQRMNFVFTRMEKKVDNVYVSSYFEGHFVKQALESSSKNMCFSFNKARDETIRCVDLPKDQESHCVQPKENVHSETSKFVVNNTAPRHAPMSQTSDFGRLRDIVPMTECNNSNDAADQNTSACSDIQYSGKIIRVEGDGRCLFRSLVTAATPKLQQSRRDEFGRPEQREDAEEETARADELRDKVVRLMRDNLHFYQQLERGIINADQPVAISYQKFLDRLEAMSKYSTMPGDLELNAAAMVLERQILVLNTSLRQIMIYGQDRYPQSLPLVVRYTKLCADVGHYDAVVLDINFITDHRDPSATDQMDSPDLCCKNFSRLTIMDGNNREICECHTVVPKNEPKNSGIELQAKKEFFFLRERCKNRHVDGKSSGSTVAVIKRDMSRQCSASTLDRKRSLGTGDAGSPENLANGRLSSGKEKLFKADGHNSSTAKTSICNVLEETGGWNCRRQDYLPQKRSCGTRRCLLKSKGRHRGSSSESLENTKRPRTVNTNENSKRGTKRRRDSRKEKEDREGESAAKKKKREKSDQKISKNKQKKTETAPSKADADRNSSLYVKSGEPSTKPKYTSYRRKLDNRHNVAKKFYMSSVRQKFNKDVKPPLPPRLPDAFSIGQCRCFLCRKKVISSTHSWLKCYLCLRVAHRECVIKESPAFSRGGDIEDIYFLCQNCVPV